MLNSLGRSLIRGLRSDWRRLRQAGVVAAEEQQRLARPVLDALDAADEDGVVAGLVRLLDEALDDRQRPVDHRRSAVSNMVRHALELVLTLAGEALRQLALILPEDVHRKGRGAADHREGVGPVIHADQDQWRLERQ